MERMRGNNQSRFEAMESEPKKHPVTPAAERALAEAAERRRARKETADRAKGEVGGRDGLDPARYGDWEKDGIASDF
jgi:hypothetical protein